VTARCVPDGQNDHVDAHRDVHRLDPLCPNRRVDQLGERVLGDRVRMLGVAPFEGVGAARRHTSVYRDSNV
jgi:hypothetical protein